jgi:anthranilate/para-aminobenzoate synthase component I
MNALTIVSTDLLTPLGAYLRLRQAERASFLLESVEQGRLGRHSFVGAGSRVVDFTEAEAGCPSSATSATTTRPGSSQRSRYPRAGAAFPRAAS